VKIFIEISDSKKLLNINAKICLRNSLMRMQDKECGCRTRNAEHRRGVYKTYSTKTSTAMTQSCAALVELMRQI